MVGGKLGKLALVVAIGAAIAAVMKNLRGEPTPVFSNHPTVTGGPSAAKPPAEAPASTEAPASEPEAKPEPKPEADEAPKAAAPSGEQTWVAPVDGGCPDGYPIKAKVKSGIFHQPGGTAYERTSPDRCYPTAEAAEADGLRAAKR